MMSLISFIDVYRYVAYGEEKTRYSLIVPKVPLNSNQSTMRSYVLQTGAVMEVHPRNPNPNLNPNPTVTRG